MIDSQTNKTTGGLLALVKYLMLEHAKNVVIEINETVAWDEINMRYAVEMTQTATGGLLLRLIDGGHRPNQIPVADLQDTPDAARYLELQNHANMN